jgi:hypothetical protein
MKVDCKYFLTYRHYVEHFRLFKYNEYISTHKCLYNYSLLRKILHRYSGRDIKDYVTNFRKSYLFDNYNIYLVEESDITDFEFQYMFLNNLLIVKNLQLTNYLKFFRVFKKNYYFLALYYFKPLMGTYLIQHGYTMYYKFNRKRRF